MKQLNIDVETLVDITDFENFFYIKNHVFHKKSNKTLTNYSNLQLGDIYSANAFNPLKTNLFYKGFNTVIILDNRLAEIYKIDFNTLQPYKNVSNITTGPDNTIWILNQDLQQLELYDYKTNTIRAKTLPIKSTVIDLKSNYNYCFLLTTDFLYVYNYFGSLITKHENIGFTAITETNGNIILKKENTLFYLKEDTKNITPIITPNFLINQFFVTNETLYIYNDETLQEFQIKTK
ncbi:MAG: hypothetical protein ABJL44_15715 [Algibacter sp.]